MRVVDLVAADRGGRERRTVIGVGGASVGGSEADELRKTPGVESVLRASQPFTLASLEVRRERTVVNVCGVLVGGARAVVIAGPCSVESREQLFETARAVKRAGASMLRGGAYKPRTSPYDFQGLGLEALRLLKEASEETGLPVVVADDPLTCVARGGGRILELMDEMGPGHFGLE